MPRDLGAGLPDTPVLDVKLAADERTRSAATFGHGVWQVLPAGR